MKKILLALFMSVLIVSISATASAEEPTQRVYAELLGTGTNFLNLNKNVKVSVDLGQFQSATKAYTLLDENGKDIKFNSGVIQQFPLSPHLSPGNAGLTMPPPNAAVP